MSCRFYGRSTRRKGLTLACRPSSTLRGCVLLTGTCLFSRLTRTLLQGLIKSSARNEQQEGVRLLSEIFRNAPERRRECLYYLALGNYKLGNYAEARRYNDLLLDHEPGNMQAGSLRGLIDDKVAKEGLVGVAIVSGLAIAAAGVGALMFKSARRR